MPKNEQQRQKKIAKKRSKAIRDRRVLTQRRAKMESMAGRMTWASRYPVHRCLVTDNIFEEGMGTVYLTRKPGDGRVAFMAVLVDLYCLGAKDAFGRLVSVSDFEEMIAHVGPTVPMDPARARKLVEGSVEYARGLGLQPHPDYVKAAPLWGDIDPAECSETFEFGRDGRPCYIAHPQEDPARQTLIFRRLSDSVGEGNFDFLLANAGTEFGNRFYFPDDDEMDDDDDFDARHDSPHPLRGHSRSSET